MLLGLMLAAARAPAQSMSISTLAGDVQIPLVHVDPGGSLLEPQAPDVPAFTAPSIHSAPLPSGSGARALGVAGAFTAIADDATAASWNPAGLIQLERPELSFVYRLKHEHQRHRSGNPDYRTGHDDDCAHALNYLSAALPFRLFGRNAVAALNYQEVYDFSQRFEARFSERSSTRHRNAFQEETRQTLFRHFDIANSTLDVTEDLTTRTTTVLDQRISTTTAGTLQFEQEGGVQALTPALALEVTPALSLGAALNLYQEGLLGPGTIRSTTRIRHSGTVTSRSRVRDTRETHGTWSYTLAYVSPTFQDTFVDSGEVTPYTTQESRTEVTRIDYTGLYTVEDRIDDFDGVNATFGVLWNGSPRLTLGACLDLPWRGRARQTKTVSSETTSSGGANESSRNTTTRNVAFDFPLFWAASAAWHWNDRLTTSCEAGQALWSDYAYRAEGEARVNPLDGSPYGERRVEDCWTLRTGTEYLWVLSRTEIPFRTGFAWEQRPAVGHPDSYWSVSLGSGISLGRGPRKLILDLAYTFSWGDDVMETLVPGQAGELQTDVRRHEFYLSCIQHF